MKYGSHEWYLYHAIENEGPVLPLIMLSAFLLICKGGIIAITIIWILYFSWAHDNNEKLNHDPKILEARKTYINIRNRENNRKE